MKGGKPQTKEQKKKAAAKKTAMGKKDSAVTPGGEKGVLEITSERRTNKHYYLKAQQDPKTGKVVVVTTKGEDGFYLGSFDGDVTLLLVNQMLQMYLRKDGDTDAGIIKANAAMASILEIDPQDPTELMLATQMTTVHNLAMDMTSRFREGEQTLDWASYYVDGINKLMRTYTTQVEALNKYRNKGKQQITVKHQHVNVNDGGQAIVGDVKQGGGSE
jgi:hypothetical protein